MKTLIARFSIVFLLFITLRLSAQDRGTPLSPAQPGTHSAQTGEEETPIEVPLSIVGHVLELNHTMSSISADEIVSAFEKAGLAERLPEKMRKRQAVARSVIHRLAVTLCDPVTGLTNAQFDLLRNELRIISDGIVDPKIEFEGKRLLAAGRKKTEIPLPPGYSFNVPDPNDFKIKWTPGLAHPSLLHVVAAADKNLFAPAPGYTWLSNSSVSPKKEGDFRVKWTPGVHPFWDSHVVALEKENEFAPDPGYEWVKNPAEGGGYDVKWVPGSRSASLPHRIAGKSENNWILEPGYDWVLDPANPKRFVLKWVPGERIGGNPLARSHVFSGQTEGELVPEIGYDWVNPHRVPGDLMVKWVPGRNASHPHCVAGKSPGEIRLDPGYVWASSGPVKAEWMAGLTLPGKRFLIATAEEGKWKPAPGYFWTSKDPGPDTNVAWVPGIAIGDASEHLVTGGKERSVAPAPGYDWAGTEDLRVKWVRGLTHDLNPHLVAAAHEGYFVPESGYTWAGGGNEERSLPPPTESSPELQSFACGLIVETIEEAANTPAGRAAINYVTVKVVETYGPAAGREAGRALLAGFNKVAEAYAQAVEMDRANRPTYGGKEHGGMKGPGPSGVGNYVGPDHVGSGRMAAIVRPRPVP